MLSILRTKKSGQVQSLGPENRDPNIPYSRYGSSQKGDPPMNGNPEIPCNLKVHIHVHIYIYILYLSVCVFMYAYKSSWYIYICISLPYHHEETREVLKNLHLAGRFRQQAVPRPHPKCESKGSTAAVARECCPLGNINIGIMEKKMETVGIIGFI